MTRAEYKTLKDNVEFKYRELLLANAELFVDTEDPRSKDRTAYHGHLLTRKGFASDDFEDEDIAGVLQITQEFGEQTEEHKYKPGFHTYFEVDVDSDDGDVSVEFAGLRCVYFEPGVFNHFAFVANLKQALTTRLHQDSSTTTKRFVSNTLFVEYDKGVIEYDELLSRVYNTN